MNQLEKNHLLRQANLAAVWPYNIPAFMAEFEETEERAKLRKMLFHKNTFNLAHTIITGQSREHEFLQEYMGVLRNSNHGWEETREVLDNYQLNLTDLSHGIISPTELINKGLWRVLYFVEACRIYSTDGLRLLPNLKKVEVRNVTASSKWRPLPHVERLEIQGDWVDIGEIIAPRLKELYIKSKRADHVIIEPDSWDRFPELQSFRADLENSPKNLPSRVFWEK